jgi:hypothetical protein
VVSPPAHAAQPLIRVRGWRALVAFGIAAGGCLVALLGVAVLLVLGVPTGLGVAIGGLWTVCGLLTAWAVEVGGWGRGVIGHVQRVAVAFELLGTAAVLTAGIVRGVGLLLELPVYGTPPSAAGPSFGVAAVAALALVLLLVAAPLEGQPTVLSRRWLQRLAAGVALVGGIATISAVVVSAAPAGCGAFDFQAERWRSEMAGEGGARLVRMGEAVRRCEIVETGMTRPQVRALLGEPSSASSGRFTWALGDDGGLLPAQGSLIIDFERRDGIHRVSDVMLLSD